MEIRRFGFGHRRPDGPPGTRGVRAALIHSDARGTVSEIAFGRRALIEPHTNPNSTWFLVVEGGGFVRVADETERVFAGEAILWPANVLHGASTDLSEMRAIVIEFSGRDDVADVADTSGVAGVGARGTLTGVALAAAVESGGSTVTDRGDGELAAGASDSPRYHPAEGEPR